MIFKVTRGTDMGHLVRYLFNEQSGPDKANEHTDCHAVAAEDGVEVPLGRQLSKAEQAELTGMLCVASDLYGTHIGAGNVWHLSLATKGGVDRDLSDEEWAEVARTVMARVGFAGPEVGEPCAWVAVRHGKSGNGNDHLHVAVNLVREGGRAASTHKLFPILGAVCAEMEARYGLTVVEGRTKKAGMPGLSRSEIHKAARAGRGAPERLEVARAVRAAAVGSRTEDEFVRRLRQAGVAVKPRYDRSGLHRVVGYSVAQQPAEGGTAVFFSGGSLAKDLTLPALRKGWEPVVDDGRAGAEWGRYRDPGASSDEVAPGVHRRYGWSEAAGEWGPGRTPAASDGRESETYDAGQWAVAATRLAGVVRDLAAVPASDEGAWQAAAQGAAGMLAGMSGRLEPTPGPLARAADVLARSAQPTTRRAGPPSTKVGAGTMRTVTALMAQAQITEEVALAWQLVLAELLRLAQAIQQAHVARGDAAQAARLAGDARTALEQARAHYGSAQRVAEMLPALVEAVGDDREQDDDDRPGSKRRKKASPLRSEDYAAIAARQRAHHPKPAAEADR